MFQTIENRKVFVVDLPYMPATPVIPTTPEEAPYAKALTLAIEFGIIRSLLLPAKFAIQIDHETQQYRIFKINE